MKISDKKREKIFEQILALLYEKSPKPLFISEIASELARDEEFIKILLINLKSKGLLVEIKKNPQGKNYIRRARWKLSETAYNSYKNHQTYFKLD